MTTNREWLYSLDPHDLAAWFDAERAATYDGQRTAKLLAQRDEYKLLAEAYKSERDVLRDENLKMAAKIAAMRETLEDDGR